MSIIESIFLGLIQGLTEFLPVSSSGHLIIAREIFGLSLEGSLAFDVFLNTATLFAVIYCFAGDLLALIKDFLTQGFGTQSKNGLTTLKGFGIGFFQALALIPGISRSGSTISGGLFFGLSREEALRFS